MVVSTTSASGTASTTNSPERSGGGGGMDDGPLLLGKQGHRESPRPGGGHLHPFAEGLLRPGRGSNLSLSSTATAAAETQPLLSGVGQRGGPTSGAGNGGAPAQDSKASGQSSAQSAALTVALPASFGGGAASGGAGPSTRVVQWSITAAIALLYMGASGCAIVINKHILVSCGSSMWDSRSREGGASSSPAHRAWVWVLTPLPHVQVDLSFPFPVTITWLGLLITTLASAAGVHLWLPSSSRRGVTLSYYLTHVMPCGFFMAVAFLTGAPQHGALFSFVCWGPSLLAAARVAPTACLAWLRDAQRFPL